MSTSSQDFHGRPSTRYVRLKKVLLVDADPVLDEPVRVKDGRAIGSARPGLGLKWNEKGVKRYAA